MNSLTKIRRYRDWDKKIETETFCYNSKTVTPRVFSQANGQLKGKKGDTTHYCSTNVIGNMNEKRRF